MTMSLAVVRVTSPSRTRTRSPSVSATRETPASVRWTRRRPGSMSLSRRIGVRVKQPASREQPVATATIREVRAARIITWGRNLPSHADGGAGGQDRIQHDSEGEKKGWRQRAAILAPPHWQTFLCGAIVRAGFLTRCTMNRRSIRCPSRIDSSALTMHDMRPALPAAGEPEASDRVSRIRGGR